MNSSQKNRVRLSVEALERRDAPATLTISPPGWVDPDIDPIVKEITASARPGLATAAVHSGGVVQWSLDGVSAPGPSAPPAADPALAGALGDSAVWAQQQTLDVDGTFAVTNVHGSKLSAAVDGILYLDGGDPLHFTIDAHIKLMGNKIEGTPTMVFDDGSTLTFYYELKLNRDTGIFEGAFWISGGTGQFEGASGRGEISYPIAASGPLTMDGTLVR